MNNPLVSIALCAYNGARFLGAQLDSIVNQTYSDIEIICVDDCSKDETYSILSAYAAKDARIRIYKNTSQVGVNKNFHRAFSHCKGSFIAIADQDDLWELNKIQVLIDNLGENLLIYSDSMYVDSTGQPENKTIGTYHNFTKGGKPERFLLQNCVSGHSLLFSRELLSYVKDSSSPVYYDWDLAYSAACLNRLTFTTAILTHYRLHETSVTGKDKSTRTLREKQLLFFKNKDITPAKTKKLIIELLANYKQVNSLSRFLFLFKNRRDLYFIRRRSWFSQLKEIFRESRVFID